MKLDLEEAFEKYKAGIEYLKKTGLVIIMHSLLGRMVFEPGSLFEDKEKETLPRPAAFSAGRLSLAFMDHFNLTTEVDLGILLRACSIILTNFSGPDEEDFPKNHQNRLKERLAATGTDCHQYLLLAFLLIEDIFEKLSALTQTDYEEASVGFARYCGLCKQT